MDVIYKKAGHIELIRYRDGKRFLKVGVVDRVSFVTDLKKSAILNSNTAFDGFCKTGMSARIEIRLSGFQQKFYSALTAMKEPQPEYVEASILTVAGVMPISKLVNPGTLRVIDELGVPSQDPYSVTISRTPVSPCDIAVYDEDNNPLAYTENEPGEGEFRTAGQELFFNMASAGSGLVIAYDATGIGFSRMQMDNNNMSTDIFSLRIAGEATLRKRRDALMFDAITIDRVIPVGNISLPERQKEAKGWEFALQLLPPRRGRYAVQFATQV